MFLIQLSVDGLALLKAKLSEVTIQAKDAPLMAEILETLRTPVVADKLVEDIQRKTRESLGQSGV